MFCQISEESSAVNAKLLKEGLPVVGQHVYGQKHLKNAFCFFDLKYFSKFRENWLRESRDRPGQPAKSLSSQWIANGWSPLTSRCLCRGWMKLMNIPGLSECANAWGMFSYGHERGGDATCGYGSLCVGKPKAWTFTRRRIHVKISHRCSIIFDWKSIIFGNSYFFTKCYFIFLHKNVQICSD